MNTKSATSLILPIVLCAIMALCSATAMAADGQTPTVQGRVMELTTAQGFDHLTILTQRGEMMRVRLGIAGSCSGLVTNGDQVRIRLLDETQVSGARLAMGMKVRRTGASYMFRNGAGEMNQQWTRTRNRDGSCGRMPGDGCPQNPQCPGDGSGRGGGSRGGNGGSMGGGGGQRGGGR